MDMHLESINNIINEGKIDEAIRLLSEYIAENKTSDEAFYLRGKAFHKKGDLSQAQNNYLSALELNPNSPASQAHAMVIQIMNFYNKDRFNP